MNRLRPTDSNSYCTTLNQTSRAGPRASRSADGPIISRQDHETPRSPRACHRPPRPLADRRPAPGPRPDVPDRLARGAAGGGRVILRIEDLDATRVRAEAVTTALIDLRWLGLDWDEGPDVGGPNGPYVQSERKSVYDRRAGTSEGDRAGLSLHLHARRHRTGRQRTARGGRGADLSRHLLRAKCGRRRVPGRSPVRLAIPVSRRATWPGTTSSSAASSSTRRGSAAISWSAGTRLGPVLSACRGRRRRGDGRQPGDPRA